MLISSVFWPRKNLLVPKAPSWPPEFRTGFRKFLGVQLVCQDLIGESRRIAKSRVRTCKKNKNWEPKRPTSSIFELENFFWCQKLRLDFLISNLPSEKNSEVGNVLKIDREYGDFCMVAGRSPDSSILELETFFWCQKLRLYLLSSEQASENF